MGQFDQFANQGGPAAESADALAEARRKTDEQLRTADYSGDLPEPLSGGKHAADTVAAADDGATTDSESDSESDSDDSASAHAASQDAALSSDGGDGGD